MCGIAGVFAFNLVGKFNKIHITQATQALAKRGPDFQDIYIDEWVGLGHRRLSVIDMRAIANQPMWDESGRYAIVFNGEIFNYAALRDQLRAEGVPFFSDSDTEVLLKWFIRHGTDGLNQLNGFFAFCIYDKAEQCWHLVRDRFGIKPLLYCFDEDKCLFASEMKSLIQFGIDRQIDRASLYNYLHLNYIPAPHTIYAAVKKVEPGHYLKINRGRIEQHAYYKIPRDVVTPDGRSYADDMATLRGLLEESVKKRLVADVPLGTFLSGGVDSSIVTALARKYKQDLHSFSIGFSDQKYFDETHYAKLVSKHLQTEHTIFSLSDNDMYDHLYAILDHTDEPFADSSAVAVYILSKEVRKHVTVALSGDGADELFGGYNKHDALLRSIHPGVPEHMISSLSWLWNNLPSSRSGRVGNKIRQLSKFAKGMKAPARPRYWKWAGFMLDDEAKRLLLPEFIASHLPEADGRQEKLLQYIPDRSPLLHDFLYTDMKLVLPNDMLTKVDLMSMAHGLEIRVPFLDYHVVNFAMRLPDAYKVKGKMRKRILQDAFKDMLPDELYNRPKKGFEVPLLHWMKTRLRPVIEDHLSEKIVREQGIFNIQEIERLKRKLYSGNPGDVHARLWSLIVFQWWWKKYGGSTSKEDT